MVELFGMGFGSSLDDIYLREYSQYLENTKFTDDAQSNTIVQMYALQHPDYVFQAWHVFVTYIITTIIACFLVCSFNKAMPYLNHAGVFFILAGFLITIIVV